MQRSNLMAERYDSDEPPVELYRRDFRAWAEEQARTLHQAGESRARGDTDTFQEVVTILDFENLAEELASLGRSEARELRHRLTTIVEHLLKAQHSPAAGPRAGPAAGPRAGWRGAVQRSRVEVARLLEESSSLKPDLVDALDKAAEDALAVLPADMEDRGEGEAGELAAAIREAVRDYTPERMLDPDWWPPMGHADTTPVCKRARERLPVAPPKRSGTKRGGT